MSVSALGRGPGLKCDNCDSSIGFSGSCQSALKSQSFPNVTCTLSRVRPAHRLHKEYTRFGESTQIEVEKRRLTNDELR